MKRTLSLATAKGQEQEHPRTPHQTWDPIPLATAYTPLLQTDVRYTSSDELNVGTFYPNQYKPCVFFAYHPDQKHIP